MENKNLNFLRMIIRSGVFVCDGQNKLAENELKVGLRMESKIYGFP